MTKTFIISAAVAVLLGLASAYTPAIKYADTLSCQSCIRGGYDFCVNGTQATDVTKPDQHKCFETKVDPSFVLPDPKTKSGYICSSALASQAGAIVEGCPMTDPQPAYCGDYLVDLSQEAFVARQIKDFPLLGSCTYRLFTTCGYPQAAVKILNEIYVGDFDIYYAAQKGIQINSDISADWVLDQPVDWEGSFGTGNDDAMDFISQGSNSAKVGAEEFEQCKGPNRNLWITVTRVKVTPKPTPTTFLSETARMLDNPPTPLRTYDIEFGFANIEGNAKFLGAVSFALMALLSVFAF